MSSPLPALDRLIDTARVVSLPLTTRFRGVDEREALLLEGPEGWAEFSPFLEYDDAEAATWLTAAIDFAWHPRPAAVRETVPVNATVPAVAADQVGDVLARFHGCRTAKVKVAERGQVLGDDVARVRAVREVMGPEGRIRVDANGGWNLDEAEHAVHALAEFDLEYVEQPCAQVEDLVELRRRIRYLGIPVAADESVRPGCVAAFSAPVKDAAEGEALIVVAEVRDKARAVGLLRDRVQCVLELGHRALQEITRLAGRLVLRIGRRRLPLLLEALLEAARLVESRALIGLGLRTRRRQRRLLLRRRSLRRLRRERHHRRLLSCRRRGRSVQSRRLLRLSRLLRRFQRRGPCFVLPLGIVLTLALHPLALALLVHLRARVFKMREVDARGMSHRVEVLQGRYGSR